MWPKFGLFLGYLHNYCTTHGPSLSTHTEKYPVARIGFSLVVFAKYRAYLSLLEERLAAQNKDKVNWMSPSQGSVHLRNCRNAIRSR